MSVAYLHNGAGAGRGRRSTATQIWGWEKMPKAIYRSGENTYELFMQFPSKGNTWYIEGVYGDKDQADEAYREAQTWLYRGKPPGIRLVRSVYSESTGEFTDQVITRRGDGFFKRSEKKIPEDVKAELKKGAAGAPGGAGPAGAGSQVGRDDGDRRHGRRHRPVARIRPCRLALGNRSASHRLTILRALFTRHGLWQPLHCRIPGAVDGRARP